MTEIADNLQTLVDARIAELTAGDPELRRLRLALAALQGSDAHAEHAATTTPRTRTTSGRLSRAKTDRAALRKPGPKPNWPARANEVIEAMRTIGRPCCGSEIARAVGTTEWKCKNALIELVKANQVHSTGRNSGRRWHLGPPAGATPTDVVDRPSPGWPARAPSLIQRALLEQLARGSASLRELVAATGEKRSTVRQTLIQMQQAGQIHSVGWSIKARWHIGARPPAAAKEAVQRPRRSRGAYARRGGAARG